jgi:iron complex transport system substrate-binding protein
VDAQLTQLAQRMPKRSVPLRVYVEVNNAPYAATEASFIGETLARLNVRNVVPAALGPFPKMNPEFVVRADPDVILLTDSQFADLAQRPGWSRLRAVQAQRVCVFTPEQSDVLVRPGPRMAEAARLMAQCLRDKAP